MLQTFIQEMLPKNAEGRLRNRHRRRHLALDAVREARLRGRGPRRSRHRGPGSRFGSDQGHARPSVATGGSAHAGIRRPGTESLRLLKRLRMAPTRAGAPSSSGASPCCSETHIKRRRSPPCRAPRRLPSAERGKARGQRRHRDRDPAARGGRRSGDGGARGAARRSTSRTSTTARAMRCSISRGRCARCRPAAQARRISRAAR